VTFGNTEHLIHKHQMSGEERDFSEATQLYRKDLFNYNTKSDKKQWLLSEPAIPVCEKG